MFFLGGCNEHNISKTKFELLRSAKIDSAPFEFYVVVSVHSMDDILDVFYTGQIVTFFSKSFVTASRILCRQVHVDKAASILLVPFKPL